MATAYIGIGTNIGNRLDNIKNAVSSLELLPNTKVLKTSKIYETDPWGYENQECFLNAAVKVETCLSSHCLLGACLGIEAAMGRIRSIKNGPRIIDLDLLFFDDEIQNSDELILPHPRIFERAFVLVPLFDVLNNEKVSAALKKIDKSGVREYKI